MAMFDAFLRIDGIDGESEDSKHKGSVDLSSFSWGETQAGTSAAGGGGGAGKVSMQDFNFTKYVDKSSPKIMLACASGQHLKDATLTVRKAGGKQEDYLVVKMTDCLVSSYQIGGSPHGDTRPSEQVSFNFAKIHVDYKPQKVDGSLDAAVPFGWDVKGNVKM